MTEELVHASCVEIDGKGVLIRGPSGGGKSDLALRLIDAGGHLIADDQVKLTKFNGRIRASAPNNLKDLLEVRGIGIMRLKSKDDAIIVLIVDLTASQDIARLPSEAQEAIQGVEIAAIALCPFEPSAAAKVKAALRLFGARAH
jgi:serine kinase of HPr protein (carbohydrate metabolism regulator)